LAASKQSPLQYSFLLFSCETEGASFFPFFSAFSSSFPSTPGLRRRQMVLSFSYFPATGRRGLFFLFLVFYPGHSPLVKKKAGVSLFLPPPLFCNLRRSTPLPFSLTRCPPAGSFSLFSRQDPTVRCRSPLFLLFCEKVYSISSLPLFFSSLPCCFPLFFFSSAGCEPNGGVQTLPLLSCDDCKNLPPFFFFQDSYLCRRSSARIGPPPSSPFSLPFLKVARPPFPCPLFANRRPGGFPLFSLACQTKQRPPLFFSFFLFLSASVGVPFPPPRIPHVFFGPFPAPTSLK